MRQLARAILLLALPLATLPAQAGKRDVTIGIIDSLLSPTLGEYRRFLVYTPPSYHDSTYLPRRYPVVYVLDGDAYFHTVSGIVHTLSGAIPGAFALPEMIVVGISNTNRTRDLTPTQAAHDQRDRPEPGFANSGGNPKFLRFIAAELIPRIERTYRTEPYRVLVGHSFGGITAINALYTMPTTFNAYVASDPSLWWDKRRLLNEFSGRLGKPGLAGRSLFVAQANTIEPADTTVDIPHSAILRFNSVVQKHNTSGLRYGYRYYPSDTHGTVPHIAMYDGLRFVFESYALSVAEAAEHPDYLAQHFARVSTVLGYRMEPSERLIDGVAFLAYASGRRMGALRLYEMNARLYASSAHAQFQLGEYWLEEKNTAKALGFYEKAVAIRPGYQAAKEMVQRLKGGSR